MFTDINDDDLSPPFNFEDDYVFADADTEAEQTDKAMSEIETKANQVPPVIHDTSSKLPVHQKEEVPPLVVSESDKVINAFEKYINRAASVDQKERLLHTMANLGIKAGDTYWLGVFEREERDSTLKAIPGRIASEVKECIAQIHEATNDQIKLANISIQRREREIDHEIDKAGFELSHKINELFDKLVVDQKITIEKEVLRKFNLKKWSLFALFAFLQMAIIISTNATVYFLATGTTALPWFEPGQGSTVGSWVFQALWNFPSGWVMSFMLVFGGIIYIWYDNFKKM